MLKKILSTALFLFLIACSSNQSKNSSPTPEITRAEAGYVYQTMSTSLALLSEIVNYCQSLEVFGYEETFSSWGAYNLKWMDATNKMMKSLAPDARTRKSITSTMDKLADSKAKNYVKTNVANVNNKVEACKRQYSIIKNGAINIDKQERVKNVLSFFLN